MQKFSISYSSVRGLKLKVASIRFPFSSRSAGVQLSVNIADLDENGNLMLATFNFRPLTEEYDIENFCMWATSYSINGTDIVAAVTPVGNSALKTNHTAVVTVSPTTSPSSVKKDSEGSSKWYIYVIASVVAVGAVAGIAVIAIKNNQEQDDEKPESNKDRKKEEKELKKNIDSSDE